MHAEVRPLIRSKPGAESGRGQESPKAFLKLLDSALLSTDLALRGHKGAQVLFTRPALGEIAFGVILPVGRPTAVTQAVDAEGLHGRIIDLGSRGTRHRAGVTYAARHPGSVVFVASEDGQVSCLFRSSTQHQVFTIYRGRFLRWCPKGQ